jgi:hypothetical protein
LFETISEGEEDEAIDSSFVQAIPARYRRYLSSMGSLLFASPSSNLYAIVVALGGEGDQEIEALDQIEIARVLERDVVAWMSVPASRYKSDNL